jgi:hypothetical protein
MFGMLPAISASPIDVMKLLKQGVTAAGVVVGIGEALALTRLLAASLYRVKATDPVTFYAMPLLILLVSACRATRIDPAVAPAV